MSRQLNNFRESKITYLNVKDFTNSVDVKRFSKQRGSIMTPINRHSNHFYYKINNKSNEKIRNTQPTSLGISFSKNISQKNMNAKRKLSTGFPCTKTNHHSVSMDSHLLKEKYHQIKSLFQNQKYQKIIPLAKNSIFHFEISNAQQNMYYWLCSSLAHFKKYDEAIQEMSECLLTYPNFYEGYLFVANAYFKTNNYRLAIENYETCVKLNQKHHQPLLQLAYSYNKLKQYKNSIEVCESGLQKFQKESQFLMILIQNYIQMKKINKLDQIMKQYAQNFNKKDSLYLYIKGMAQNSKMNEHEAYILFQQSIKFNNNRIGVSKSLMQTIKIEISKRDFYKAHHSICRIKLLQIQQTQEMKLYQIFIQGAMTMMKKKSLQAIQILNKLLSNKKCQDINLLPLLYKYLGYGYFKISQYSKSIKYYNKLNQKELDQSSEYNKLLVEGIELAENMNNFKDSISKFNLAKKVYPQKVQPYIYIAMTLILQFNLKKDKDDKRKAQVLIQALKQMQLGNKLNQNSSNLLYHRTIIHLYFEDWQQAHNDINRCIQKAQENLPKYFYLRGVCYTCVKQFKKAINEYSICLSLDNNYTNAYLQKAKCYFLVGNTQKGFSSLKTFMELSPNDLSIYKWIGDLLYQGMSYQDALKAYAELGEVNQLEVHVMKLKCLFRVGNFNQISISLKNLQKHQQIERQKISLDITAFNLLNALLKNDSSKAILKILKKLNKFLQQNNVGYIFQLIDCMNLIGIASFYSQKYVDAYESFLLVLQLYQSLSDKQAITLKSQSCDEELDLKTEDIYFNIIISQYAQGNIQESIRMINEDYLNIIKQAKKKKLVQKILKLFKNGQNENIQWDLKNDKPINNKLKKVELIQSPVKLKTKPCFNLYHESASHLYSSFVAEKIVDELHPGYIDNMPEGPWIKRNTYGVVFTEDVIQADNSISFENSQRVSQSNAENSLQSQSFHQQKKIISKRQQFLNSLKFDQAVEAKLNRIMKKQQK